jgi:hypothetical protein
MSSSFKESAGGDPVGRGAPNFISCGVEISKFTTERGDKTLTPMPWGLGRSSTLPTFLATSGFHTV